MTTPTKKLAAKLRRARRELCLVVAQLQRPLRRSSVFRSWRKTVSRRRRMRFACRKRRRRRSARRKRTS